MKPMNRLDQTHRVPLLVSVQEMNTMKKWRRTMNSRRFSARFRVLGWMVYCLLLSAPATILASGKPPKDAAKTAQAPSPSALETGLISDFEDGSPSAKFGTSWMLSTDSLAGGKSTGEIKVVDSGANGDKHALDISGLIGSGLPYAWAGAIWSPGN